MRKGTRKKVQFFVVGVRDKDTGNFVIKANENRIVGQCKGKKAALAAFKKAAHKHGLSNVELFQLAEYRIEGKARGTSKAMTELFL